MTRELTLKDATYERLADRAATDERSADVIRRLLEATGDQGQGAGGRRDRDQLAEQAMTLDELAAADSSDLTPAEYLAAEHGVDASRYSDDLELRAALADDADRDRDQSGGAGAGAGAPRATATAGATGATTTGTGTGTGGGADQLAEQALTIGDLAAADEAGIGPTEYLAREYDVDATEYSDEGALLEAVRATDGGAGR